MILFRVGPLPGEALAAAARFHDYALPRLRAMAGQGDDALVVAFDPADHTHHGWRLAAIQGLAREYAPRRVNAVEASDETALAAIAGWLDRAPGITGHLIPADGQGAGTVVS